MQTRSRQQLGAIGLVLVAAATAAASHGAAPGDAEAIATIIAIDSAVIIHADLAMTKKLSDPVLAYVQDIRGDNADDAEEIADVAKELGVDAVATAAVRLVHSEAYELIRTLDKLDGPAFEKAYLDSTIADQTKALKTFERLMSTDVSGDVKGHLKDMLGNTQKHLSRAKALRKP